MKIVQTSKINEAVYLRFCTLRSKGLSTLGSIIKEKAKILSKKFPDENKDFKACEGWLHKWKTFYYIHQLNVNGENVSEICYELGDTISDRGYCIDLIFNVSQSELQNVTYLRLWL